MIAGSFFCLVAFLVTPVIAETYTWIGAEGQTAEAPGEWSTGTNWSGGTVPTGSGDTITIGADGYVTSASQTLANSSTLNLSGNLKMTGNLNLNSDSSFTQTGGILDLGTLYRLNVGYNSTGHYVMDVAGWSYSDGSVTTATASNPNACMNVLQLGGNGKTSGGSSITLTKGTLVANYVWLGTYGGGVGDSTKTIEYTFTLDGAELVASKQAFIGYSPGINNTMVSTKQVTNFYMKSGTWTSNGTTIIGHGYSNLKKLQGDCSNTGIVTISGGVANFNGGLTIGYDANELVDAQTGEVVGDGTISQGILNIVASKATISAKTLTANAGQSTINFTAGEFGLNADGTVKSAVSTINVTDTATIDGAISVDMSNYFSNGATYVTGDLTQTLISAATLNCTTVNTATVTPGWNLGTVGNNLVLTFDELQFAFADVSSGSGFALGNLGTEGWVTLTGDASETVDLSMAYSGVENVEDFVTWLQESIGDGVTVSGSDDVITFENLVLDEYGKGYLNFDLSAYTGGNVSFIDGSNHVPEPATWAMLVIGLTVASFFRKRKGR